MAKSTLQRLLDSGLEFSTMSRQQAESVVRQLVKTGEVQRRDAEELVQTLMNRGREATEQVSDRIQNELVKQIGRLSDRLDSVERTLETVVGHATPSDSKSSKKTETKKTETKKTETKKAKSKNTSKKKQKKKQKKKKTTTVPASTAPVRAREPVGPSGVRRVATTRASRDAG